MTQPRQNLLIFLSFFLRDTFRSHIHTSRKVENVVMFHHFFLCDFILFQCPGHCYNKSPIRMWLFNKDSDYPWQMIRKNTKISNWENESINITDVNLDHSVVLRTNIFNTYFHRSWKEMKLYKKYWRSIRFFFPKSQNFANLFK